MKKILMLFFTACFLFWSVSAWAYALAELEFYEVQYNDGEQTSDDGYYSSSDYLAYFGASGQVYYSRNYSPPPPGSIAVGPNDSIAYSNGYADTANMEMGASSRVFSNYSGNSDAQITSSARNMFTVLPGDSGLDYGDIVTLNLSYQVDGSFHASDSGDDASYSPWASMDYRLTLTDPSIQFDTGEGYWTPDLVELSGGGLLQGGMPGGEIWVGQSADWSESRWNRDLEETEDLGYWSDWQEWYDQSSVSYYFDTENRNIFFDVAVGNPIYIEGYLETWIQFWYTGSSTVDFFDTFGLNFSSTTEGTIIDWEVAPTETAAVPIPAAFWLLGSGLAVLAFRRKPRLLG